MKCIFLRPGFPLKTVFEAGMSMGPAYPGVDWSTFNLPQLAIQVLRHPSEDSDTCLWVELRQCCNQPRHSKDGK
jgi:hypothetical protein